MRRYLSGDRLAALVFMAVMAGYAYQAEQLSKALRSDVIGPSLFPLLIAVTGFGLAVILFLRPEEKTDDEDGATARERIEHLIPWFMLVAYVGALPWIGFPLATFIFVGSMLKLLRQPTLWGAALLSLIITAAAYLLFVVVLNVPLPMGPFGEAY